MMKTQNHSTVDLLPRLLAPSVKCHKIEKKWNLTTTTSFRHGYSIVLQLCECFSQLLIAVLTERADATAEKSIDKPEILKKAVKWKKIREARDALDFYRNLMKAFQILFAKLLQLVETKFVPKSFRWAFYSQENIPPTATFLRTSLMKNSDRRSFAIEFNSPIRRTSIFEQFPKRSNEELNFHFQFPSESTCTAISFELLFIYLFIYFLVHSWVMTRGGGKRRRKGASMCERESYDLKRIRHIGSQNKHFSIKWIVSPPCTPNTHHDTLFYQTIFFFLFRFRNPLPLTLPLLRYLLCSTSTCVCSATASSRTS